ncbi:uncharacterized protein F5Z01DRAFT_533104 [Emericellopsis atlantica]|uniref:DUF7492 domain-containing protein n=1 Tax=Emericellopsis atlantica TaxID=2614577 RepID=A0A9P7ZPQ6_9HYPO|nr:uncharacterized protein F5Z01DRAFT_533104 [Emericellopsis atlantica]KAG9256013.1 hypothetical protein F5Z01DRAFT_533104 [Emericellopsis atlantica]
MKFTNNLDRAGLGLLLCALPATVDAHSWVEKIFRINPDTRQFLGSPAYARGGDFRALVPEGMTDDKWIYRLPPDGGWTGDENINKQPLSAAIADMELDASPGDWIAIQHLENGHVTTKAPGRPLNSGTLFLYGTTEPTDNDKIADIHLKWNADGTGGNKKGKLLATRNFDDLQCYEGRPPGTDDAFARTRASAIGTDPADSLPCQADIQLPTDLEPNSRYTIYWLWDWPILDETKIDMNATAEGKFPWSGSWVRGDKDIGFDSDVILNGESYTSTIDINIVPSMGNASISANQAAANTLFQGKAEPYSEAIKEQLSTDYGVSFPQPAAGDGEAPVESSPGVPAASETSTTPEESVAPQPEDPVASCTGAPMMTPDPVTVTVTVTDTPAAPCTSAMSTSTVTEVVTQTTTVTPSPSSKSTSTSTVIVEETQYVTVAAPEETPVVVNNAAMPASTTRRGFVLPGFIGQELPSSESTTTTATVASIVPTALRNRVKLPFVA